jgi:micrococcal nuclease
MYQYKAEVVRVIDGDTVELLVDVGFQMHFKGHFRLLGINAPEMPTPEGLPSKVHLESELKAIGPVINVETFKPDKYGRWLVRIPDGYGSTINKRMINKGFAVEYMAGKD